MHAVAFLSPALPLRGEPANEKASHGTRKACDIQSFGRTMRIKHALPPSSRAALRLTVRPRPEVCRISLSRGVPWGAQCSGQSHGPLRPACRREGGTMSIACASLSRPLPRWVVLATSGRALRALREADPLCKRVASGWEGGAHPALGFGSCVGMWALRRGVPHVPLVMRREGASARGRSRRAHSICQGGSQFGPVSHVSSLESRCDEGKCERVGLRF